MGHNAAGVEPFAPAMTVARALARSEDVEIDIRVGMAEAFPSPIAASTW